MSQAILEYLTKVEEASAALRDRVCRGAAPTFEDYKELVGELKGLQKARTLLEEMMKTIPKENRT